MVHLFKTEKLERLAQKEIIRFYTYLMSQQALNPDKFKNSSFEIDSVNVNDDDTMTNVEIKIKGYSKSYIYVDYHAKDYSCWNQDLSPISYN
jgi:hypothetical protein